MFSVGNKSFDLKAILLVQVIIVFTRTTMVNKVYIIEDNIMYAAAMQQALANEPYDIEVFHSGQEFLDNLHRNPDVVTIDYMLPDMSGMDVLKKIQEYNSEMNCIFLSGQEDVNKVVEAYKTGVKSYIVKNDNSDAISTSDNDISDRTKTTEYVTWSLGSWGYDVDYSTPDLSDVVQEVTDRTNWQSGNDMTFMIYKVSGSQKKIHNH